MPGGRAIFGISGWSGSGKTTLITRLIPEICGRGLTVSTIKHAHHRFDIDQPGKDSYEHRAAGATEVLVSSAARWALIHEHRGAPEPSLIELTEQMKPVDLLLIEGFKSEFYEKLEVHRPSIGKELLCASDDQVVAVASDAALPSVTLPTFDLDDVIAIADFIVARCGLDSSMRGTA
ncbi:MAG: molybdopterin-guanine dinucleotide biosynthesis protein B [Rhodospirillales bacterium]|nr:molybdopterin-guanine dinucleotide biosynthesis protein B [Rhodospirillales bacterium]